MGKIVSKNTMTQPHSKAQKFFRAVGSFCSKNVVMLIAIAAAIVTMFFVPPDSKYVDYFDFRTLTCLFCVLAVICAFRNIRFFYVLAQKVIQRFKNLRACVLALVTSPSSAVCSLQTIWRS